MAIKRRDDCIVTVIACGLFDLRFIQFPIPSFQFHLQVLVTASLHRRFKLVWLVQPFLQPFQNSFAIPLVLGCAFSAPRQMDADRNLLLGIFFRTASLLFQRIFLRLYRNLDFQHLVDDLRTETQISRFRVVPVFPSVALFPISKEDSECFSLKS